MKRIKKQDHHFSLSYHHLVWQYLTEKLQINTLNFLAMSNPVEVNYILENINMDELRGRSMTSSRNISRALLAHLDISLIPYIENMEIQSNDYFWFNQTKQKNFQLLYISPKEGISPDQNKAYSLSYSSSTCVEGKVLLNNGSN